MNVFKQNWFTEINDLWPGIAQSLKVQKLLYSGKSKYQQIEVLQTQSHGRALILDGIIQCTERDQFSYQEMISFLPLCSHTNPESVLIVGGGDGGVAREVAKLPSVSKIFQVEIDEKVIQVSKKYLPFMATGFSSPKVELHVGDGFEFIKNHTSQFDVIITDSSDPVGPAVTLFQKSYFKMMKKALKPNGIICSQAGTIWADMALVKKTLEACKNVFSNLSYGLVSVPTYPTGQIGFILATDNTKIDFREPVKIFSNIEQNGMNLRYYDEKIHRASFVLPKFASEELRI